MTPNISFPFMDAATRSMMVVACDFPCFPHSSAGVLRRRGAARIRCRQWAWRRQEEAEQAAPVVADWRGFWLNSFPCSASGQHEDIIYYADDNLSHLETSDNPNAQITRHAE